MYGVYPLTTPGAHGPDCTGQIYTWKQSSCAPCEELWAEALGVYESDGIVGVVALLAEQDAPRRRCSMTRDRICFSCEHTADEHSHVLVTAPCLICVCPSYVERPAPPDPGRVERR